MDELLVKYLLGETTAAEEQTVLQWLHAHEDNQCYFDHFKLIWTESKKLEQRSNIDENQAWEKFRLSIAQHTAPTGNVVAFEPPPKRNSFMKAAAGIALLILGSLSVYYFGFWNNSNEIMLASGDQVLTDTLPDGSVITLNKHATLAYAKNFNTKTRNVTLTGEAFFNVAPNKQKPFEITVNEVKVHVVGTSFNIKSNTEQTEVIVETGIVDVGVASNKVKLLPKQKVLVRKNNNKLQVQNNIDDLYNYYRTNTFVCVNTPLYQFADALSAAYHAKVTVKGESTRNLPLNTTFKDMSLDQILEVVAKTFNVNIEKTNGIIVIK